VPSFNLIRPKFWPQYTNVTDRQDRQIDRTDRQRTDSTGRAVLQTVAQKAVHKQTNKPVGVYGPIAPPGSNAPSSECPPNIMPISEFQTCPDPELPNALHSEFMNTPNVEFLNVPVCSAPMSYLAGSKLGRPLCYGHAAARWCLQRV